MHGRLNFIPNEESMNDILKNFARAMLSAGAAVLVAEVFKLIQRTATGK